MSVNLWPRSEALGTPIGVIDGGRKSIKPEYNLRIFFFEKEEVWGTELSFRGVRGEAQVGVWDEPGFW